MIMHIFADGATQGWIWQKALELLRFRLLRLMGGIGIKAKMRGEILSSNGLLRDDEGVDKIISKVKRFSCCGQ